MRSVDVFYNGLKNSKGELIFSGQALGNPMRELRPEDISNPVSDTVRILAFQNPSYDWHSFDLDRDMPLIADAVGYVDAVDPDLRAFKAHGGKLLLYTGWGDTGISPENTVLYYESVRAEMGADKTIGCDCSWCPEWGIAAAATVRTRSTRSPRSNGGASKDARRTKCSARILKES